jgi:hypothetical protein
MAGRKTSKVTQEDIAEYWVKWNNISELELNFDWSDCATHCWNCGGSYILEKAHIIPHALGGADRADNYVLLCSACHSQAPNTANKQDIWDWIKRNYKPLSFYDSNIMHGFSLYMQREPSSKTDRLPRLTSEKLSEYLRENINTHGGRINAETWFCVWPLIFGTYNKDGETVRYLLKEKTHGLTRRILRSV